MVMITDENNFFQAFKPGRVKLKEIGFDLYPTKVAGFFLCFFLLLLLFFLLLPFGGIYRKGGGEGKGFGATMLNSESCRQRWRAYRVRDHSFKTFSRL